MDYAIQGLIQAVTPFLDGTCDIYHQQTGTDDTGGSAQGYPSTPDIASVACQLRPVNLHPPKSLVVGAQSQSITLWMLRLPVGTTIKPTDKIVKSGVAYAVTGEYGPPQSDNVNTLAYLVEFRTT